MSGITYVDQSVVLRNILVHCFVYHLIITVFPRQITGIMTQGRGDGNEWVTTYMVSHSMDAYHWQYLSDKYGNQKLFDGDTSVMNLVKLFMIKDGTYGDNSTIKVTR